MKRLVYFMILFAIVKSDWMDPHDMNIKVKAKYLKTRSKSTSLVKNDDVCDNSDIIDVTVAHLKRTVSLLMNVAHFEKQYSENYNGYIRFQMSPDNVEFLRNFAQKEITIDHLRKLDTVLSASFHKSLLDEYLESAEFFKWDFYSSCLNVLYAVPYLMAVYFIFQLVKNDFSLRYIIKYSLVLLMLGDFGLRYKSLLEEAENYNADIKYSADCDPSKMLWRDYFTFIISKKDCERKTVTPLDVFLYQVKNLIIVPLHAFGIGFGKFGRESFTTLPWVLNIVLWPVLLIFVAILAIFSMVFMSTKEIELNIFHLFKLKLGETRSVEVKRVENMPSKNVIENTTHRRFIEDVSVTEHTKKKISPLESCSTEVHNEETLSEMIVELNSIKKTTEELEKPTKHQDNLINKQENEASKNYEKSMDSKEKSKPNQTHDEEKKEMMGKGAISTQNDTKNHDQEALLEKIENQTV